MIDDKDPHHENEGPGGRDVVESHQHLEMCAGHAAPDNTIAQITERLWRRNDAKRPRRP